MRVLVACEFSGVVRDAFRERGHDAWSCDLLPSERTGNDHVGDAISFVNSWPYLYDPLRPWDLMIAHPPCTFLANSGARWLYENGQKSRSRWIQMGQAAQFFKALLTANVSRIAVENPIIHGHAAAIIGHKPNQIIQPWQFGHGEIKATCFWLKNLPPLRPTMVVDGRAARVHRAAPSPDRWKERSRTLPGIAAAMAEQWGDR